MRWLLIVGLGGTGWFFVKQNTEAFFIEVIKLFGAHRPEEYRDTNHHKDNGNGDQDVDNTHTLSNRNELDTTSNELQDMPITAT